VTEAVTSRESGPAPLRTLSYARDWSVVVGGTLQVMVSCQADTYQAEVIRVTGRGPRPPGDAPALSYLKEPEGAVATYPGHAYQIISGSYGVVDGIGASEGGAAALTAWVYPTLPRAGRRQTILSWPDRDGKAGVELGINGEGRLCLSFPRPGGGRAEVESPVPLEERRWCFVGGSVDPATGRTVIVRHPAGDEERRGQEVTTEESSPAAGAWHPGATVLVAAAAVCPAVPDALSSVMEGSYNGKIEQASALGRVLDGAQLLDSAERPRPDGLLGMRAGGIRWVNAPMERMTGHSWSGHALRGRMVS
jgi:hypothetical protein